MRTLILDGNALTQLDDSLRTLEKLEYFHASNNAIHTIQYAHFKNNLNSLRQLDLSGNKLQTISTELFTLPHLEWLNLANNLIGKLPAVHSSHVRAIPIYSLDLSGNQLSKFYDYVLHLAHVVDMSANRLKTLPKKSISKLSESELSSRVLKLDANPMVDPPMDVCADGLRSIREYFEEEARHVQLNKGFKIVILGECKSGKTSLAYALEDYHTKSNLIEQYHTSGSLLDASVSATDDVVVNDGVGVAESKLVEVHEFYMNANNEDESDESRDKVVQTPVLAGKSTTEAASRRGDVARVGSASRTRPSDERRGSTTAKVRGGNEERRGSRIGSAQRMSIVGSLNRRTSVSKSVCFFVDVENITIYFGICRYLP